MAAAGAAQNAMALIGANLHPGGWSKGESHEENLRTFNKWYKAYCRYTNVCLRSINVDVTQKWDLFAATGGDDLADAIEEAGIIMTEREGRQYVPEVPYLPYREAGEDNNPPERQEQQHVPAVPALDPIVATPFEEGIELIRAVIGKYSNLIMQRKILMTEMPASDYADWRKWGQMLKKQAQRCNYDDGTYTSDVASLDALLFQCPDAEWRRKILAGNMDFQQAIDYGMRYLTAKNQANQLALANRNGNGSSQTQPVDRVEEEKKTFDCDRCTKRHAAKECKAFGQKCTTCRSRATFPNPQTAKGNPKQTQEVEEEVDEEANSDVETTGLDKTAPRETRPGPVRKTRRSTKTSTANTESSGKRSTA